MVGDDLFAVATDVLDRLLGGGGELVTLVAGRRRPATWPSGARRTSQDAHPTVDVVVYDGGQPRYPLLVGVE